MWDSTVHGLVSFVPAPLRLRLFFVQQNPLTVRNVEGLQVELPYDIQVQDAGGLLYEQFPSDLDPTYKFPCSAVVFRGVE